MSFNHIKCGFSMNAVESSALGITPYLLADKGLPHQANRCPQLRMTRSTIHDIEIMDIGGGPFGDCFPGNFDAVLFIIDNSVIVQQLEFEVG